MSKRPRVPGESWPPGSPLWDAPLCAVVGVDGEVDTLSCGHQVLHGKESKRRCVACYDEKLYPPAPRPPRES